MNLFSILVLCFALQLQSWGQDSFPFDKLIGNWKQTTGSSLTPNKNQLTVEKTADGKYSGYMTIVESKKTIQYQLEFIYLSDKKQWQLLATRDKKTTEWLSSEKNNAIYFTCQVKDNNEVYFLRQGFSFTDGGDLLRSVEKSYDGENFQGMEEKYQHEK